MADAQVGTVLRHIRRVAVAPQTHGLSDAQLLQRFCAGREEVAFAALLQRYGGVVWAVCRRVLGHTQDAEDAFQATFLALAQHAETIRKGEAVAGWLHGAAYRVAMRAKRDAARRRAHERRAHESRAGADCRPAPPSEGAWRELQAALDEELQALPPRQRAVFVLCVLENQSQARAAAALGWKEGTVAGTLARARRRLRGRLARRGVALSALLTGLALAGRSARAAPLALAEVTLRSAVQGAPEALPPQVAALVKGVPGVMPVSKKITTVVLLVLGLAAVAGGVAPQTVPPQAPPAERGGPPKPAARDRGAADALGDPLPPGAVGRLGTVRFRHGAEVDAFALSRDGRILATAAGPVAVLWDAATGKELRRLKHDRAVTALAFTPDGKRIASGASDNRIRLWDAADGKEVRCLEGHGRPQGGEKAEWRNGIYALVFTPDGRTLISRGVDETVRVWDVATGAERRRVDGVPGSAWALALSPDARVLAVPVADFQKGMGEVRLAEVATGKEVRRLARGGVVNCVAFSPDGSLLAVGVGEQDWQRPGDIKLCDAATGKELRTLRGHRRWVNAVVFSPDGKALASGSLDASPRLWDVASGAPRRTFGDGRMPVRAAAFSPDGKLLTLLTGHVGDHAVRVWDVAANREVRRLAGHQSHVGALAFSADSRRLASGSADAAVGVWDVRTRKELHRLPAGGAGVAAVGFSADGRTAVAGGLGSNVHAWDAGAGKEVRHFGTGDGFYGRMAVAPDGRVLASWGRQSGAVRLWDTATGKELRKLGPVPEWVNALAFSPDGKLLAVGTGKGPSFIGLWDVETGRSLRQFAPENWVLSLAFAPDGRTLASGHDDRKVRLWELATGGLRLAFDHGTRPAALAFSADGNLLASACNETGSNRATNGFTRTLGQPQQEQNKVLLWDALSGRRLHALDGHRGAVVTLAFSPDGRLLASGSNDTTVLLWDATRLPRPDGGRAAGPKELKASWADLAGADSARAYAALAGLVGSPARAVALLKEHLRPIVPADARRLDRLLTDLGSGAFAAREKAARELRKLGLAAESALRRALAAGPGLEARRRIEGLLAQLEASDQSRLGRAVEVLERIGTPAARQLLQTLAAGEAEARLTREAQAALRRLTERAANGP